MTATERIKILYRETSKPLLWLLLIGALVVIAYGLVPLAAVSTTTLGLLASLAALIAGIVVGFLFGIPRRIEGEPRKQPGYAVNTNLEQVSDWLTKALLGIGLVELGNLATGFGKLSRALGAALGGGGAGVGVAAAIIAFFTPVGFLCGYLWARTFFTGVLADLEAIVATPVAPQLDAIQEHADRKAVVVAAALRDDGGDEGQTFENREPLVDVPAPVVDQVSDFPSLWREIEAVLVGLAGAVGDEFRGTDGVITVLQRRGLLDDATVNALRQLSQANKELSGGAVLSEEDSTAVRVAGADTLAALARLRRFGPAAFEQHVLTQLQTGAAPGWDIEFDAKLSVDDQRPFRIDAVVRRGDQRVGVEVKAQGPGTRTRWNTLLGWLGRVPETMPVLLVLPGDTEGARALAAAKGTGNLRILAWDTEADQLVEAVRGMLDADAT